MIEGALLPNSGVDQRLRRSRVKWALLILMALAGLALWRGWVLAWLCDDAFASFRYADNWARGLGLVFNANERVEGISNPLWTLMLGVLGRAGFNIESTAIGLGLSAHVSCVLLLALAAHKGGLNAALSRPWLPIGAIVAVADTDLSTFATGGLETSLFTVSVLASFVVAWLPSNGVLAGVCAGLFVAVSGMVRPDGILFVAPLALAFFGGRRRGLGPYMAVSLILLASFHAWRWRYYGSVIPNTYYAKSAFSSWWSQGAIYLGYFSIRHAALLIVASTLSLVVFWQACSNDKKNTDGCGPTDYLQRCIAHRLIVAWAMILVYTVSVVRVGGDFMYARLLVPVIPLFAIAFDMSATHVWGARPVARGLIGVLIAGVAWAAPCPVDTDIVAHHGIVDERAYYQLGYAESIERIAGNLRSCIAGFPARAAIYGGELRLAYRARIPYAIEAHAGLTDAVIARRPLSSRQRIGHEKSADASYLVLTKKAHFATSPLYSVLSDPNGFIPEVHADLCGVDVRLLHWDPVFVEYVRARGASVPDFPAWLDRWLARIDSAPDSWAQAQWNAAEHFYFAHNEDPRREAAFEARLRRSGGNQAYPPRITPESTKVQP